MGWCIKKPHAGISYEIRPLTYLNMQNSTLRLTAEFLLYQLFLINIFFSTGPLFRAGVWNIILSSLPLWDEMRCMFPQMICKWKQIIQKGRLSKDGGRKRWWNTELRVCVRVCLSVRVLVRHKVTYVNYVSAVSTEHTWNSQTSCVVRRDRKRFLFSSCPLRA